MDHFVLRKSLPDPARFSSTELESIFDVGFLISNRPRVHKIKRSTLGELIFREDNDAL